jgi:hypothetical protein
MAFYNIVFKVKHKLYIASGHPLPQVKNSGRAPALYKYSKAVSCRANITVIKKYVNVSRKDKIMAYQAERTRCNSQTLLTTSGKTASNSSENHLNFIFDSPFL